jgi:putative oxidoreductase
MFRTGSDEVALLLLRMAGLAVALVHGWGKIVALSSGQAAGFVGAVAALGFPLPLVFAWAAALSEFLGGLLVALGLKARIAAAFAAFTMAVAALAQHHALERLLVAAGWRSVPEATLKSWGNPELALLYLLVFGVVILKGPGRLSLDGFLGR